MKNRTGSVLRLMFHVDNLLSLSLFVSYYIGLTLFGILKITAVQHNRI